MQRKLCDRIGVAVAKLKCPKPAPWIWMTGFPWPVSLYQIRTPLILASGMRSSDVVADWPALDCRVKGVRSQAPVRAELNSHVSLARADITLSRHDKTN